jgi:hypothetical protein
MEKRKLVRVNTNITEEINEWLNSESARTGVPKSSLILMALSQYKDQKNVMAQIPELLNAMQNLQTLEKN